MFAFLHGARALWELRQICILGNRVEVYVKSLAAIENEIQLHCKPFTRECDDFSPSTAIGNIILMNVKVVGNQFSHREVHSSLQAGNRLFLFSIVIGQICGSLTRMMTKKGHLILGTITISLTSIRSYWNPMQLCCLEYYGQYFRFYFFIFIFSLLGHVQTVLNWQILVELSDVLAVLGATFASQRLQNWISKLDIRIDTVNKMPDRQSITKGR